MKANWVERLLILLVSVPVFLAHVSEARSLREGARRFARDFRECWYGGLT